MAFDRSSPPSYFFDADWTTTGNARNGVFYAGDTVAVPLVAVGQEFGVHTGNFETGVDGDVVSTSDFGSLTRWTTVNGTPTYSATHAYEGLSAKLSAVGDELSWTYPVPAPEEYFRFYLYATANPSAEAVLWRGQRAFLNITTAGKLKIAGGSFGADTATTAASISLNQWVRIEAHIVYEPGLTGTFEAKLFNSPDSAVATETISGVGWITTTNPSGGEGSRFGLTVSGWGTDIWMDNIQALDTAYPGPYVALTPPTFDYEVKDYYGDTVSTGSFSRATITPTPPGGGWENGWYRVYITGTETDPDWGDSYGATNFCVIRSDANFPTMPDPSVLGNDLGTERSDMVMKGIMLAQTSRLLISNADAPTTGTDTIAIAEAEAAISEVYWVEPGDPGRDRHLWCSFINGGYDTLAISGSVSGTYGHVFCKTGVLDGSQVFVQVAAGTTASTDKILVYYPNNSTLVETYDNLASATAAQAATAASSYITFFTSNSSRAAVTAKTAIGNTFFAGVSTAVAALYAAGVTRFEGPLNEGTPSAELAHKMMLFQAAVHDGDAAAVAIGPSPVDILNLTAWAAFLNAGGGTFCDEFSFHAYNFATNGDLNLGKYTLAAFEALLALHGQETKTRWQTESTGVFTSVALIYQPRRARVPILQTLLMEQHAIPAERNSQWYDLSHGFWSFPAWLENADGSLNPQCVLVRVLSEETYGKPYASALDFGTPGNNIFVGNVYTAASGASTVALMATSFIPDCAVTLTLTGAPSPVVIDGFGNTASVPLVSGRITVPLTDVPCYVELPAGATVAVYGWNDQIGIYGQPDPPTTTVIGGTSQSLLLDGAFETNYSPVAGYYYSTIFNAASSGDPDPGYPGDSAYAIWDDEITVSRVIVWCGQAWQGAAALVDFDIETYDGVAWTVRKTVTRTTPTSFLFGADETGTGTQRETYWDEQWVFDEALAAPVVCFGVRLTVRATSYGGSPDWAAQTLAFSQGGSPRLVLQEMGVYTVDAPTPPSSSGLTPVGPDTLALTPVSPGALALIPIDPAVLT